ncbi:MAG: hypothetical protein WKF89_09680 [Chitinophagaceae bacterium]
MPIQSIDASTRIVTFQHKAGKVFTNDFTNEGARYVIDNVWEGLNAPGKWYLNKKTGILYYYPIPGEDLMKAEVIAPAAPELLRLEGDPIEGKPIAYLRFKGLVFKYTHFDLPAGISNDSQSWSYWRQRGKDVHSLYTDPMFIDAGALDFRLRPQSPAFKLGFKPIDMKKVGVRK